MRTKNLMSGDETIVEQAGNEARCKAFKGPSSNCVPNPCQSEGTQMDFEVGYLCECVDGYRWVKTSIHQ